MMAFRVVLIVLASLLPLGCVTEAPRGSKPVQAAVFGPPDYRHFDLATMTHYAGYVAGLSAVERITECNKLIRGEEGDSNSLSIRFHIAFVMLLTAECGGPEQALPIFESIRGQALQNDLRSLVAYQVALASRLIEHSGQNEILQQQIGSLNRKAELLNQRLKTKNSELEELETTLDALKKIEKTFHQRSEPDGP
ncbi:MAG: hypothetical protein L0Y39_01115 [Methylococcaceae bacterium]|nr:hypothetical protein [Methylococcaceae bacterium]